MDPSVPRVPLLWMTVVTEGALLALAVGLGWWFGWRWWAAPASLPGALAGVATGAALAAGVIRLAQGSAPVFARLRADLRDVVRHMRVLNGTTDLLLISALAGLGEEALFRGLLHTALADQGAAVAVGVGAAAFGLFHPISVSYVLYTGAIGLVLGALAWGTGELLPAMLAHATFDAVALWWGVRSALAEAPEP
ncbi:MAG: CPBP family intramembrane metalloprotease [Alphaproteobacteria bacterium]|nr:CPBP family intramembrane metalloprotease [Alphaproteobacteria bacterium]